MTDPQPPQPSEPIRWRVRRSPNYVAFLLTGAVLGVVAGAIVDLTGPPAPDYGPVTSAAFLGAAGALVGALLGGLVAVLLESALRRFGR